MDFNRFKASRSSYLSKVDILGSFDFFTYLVSLDAFERPHVDEAMRALGGGFTANPVATSRLSGEAYERIKKLFSVLVHEYTHFIDSSSTLWGLKHLKLMNEAYQSDVSFGAKEHDFHKAKIFHDHCLTIRLPNYYSTVYEEHGKYRNWMSTPTIGRLFGADGAPSSRPILFTRFAATEGVALARSPLSTVSILEASAVAQEVLFHSGMMLETEEGFHAVESRRYSEMLLRQIYDQNLTEYSVCVHMVANQQNCSDVLAALIITSLITRQVLNMPDAGYDLALQHCDIPGLLRIPEGHEFARALRDGLEKRDLGIMFFLLVNAMPENSYESQAAAEQGMRSALSKVGLDESILAETRVKQADALFDLIKVSRVPSIVKIANAGRENLSRISEFSPGINFAGLNLPPVLLGDGSACSFLSRRNNSLHDLNLDSAFNEMYAGQNWVERFSEGRVQQWA